MGIFDGLIGNASEAKQREITKELEGVLIPNEEVDLAFKLVRDMIVFTNLRLIIVDKQGVTGKKASYKSLPYKSISRFSVETSGHFDLDAELKIWVSSGVEPAEALQFRKDKNITAVQQALAMAVLSK